MRLKRDDGSEVDVDYTVISYGSLDSWLDPGDPAEIEMERITDLDGNEIEVSEAERQRFDEEICAAVYSEGPSDDYDY